MAKASGTTRKKTLPHKDGEVFSEGQKIALQNYVEKGNANYFARNGETTDDINLFDIKDDIADLRKIAKDYWR